MLLCARICATAPLRVAWRTKQATESFVCSSGIFLHNAEKDAVSLIILFELVCVRLQFLKIVGQQDTLHCAGFFKIYCNLTEFIV